MEEAIVADVDAKIFVNTGNKLAILYAECPLFGDPFFVLENGQQASRGLLHRVETHVTDSTFAQQVANKLHTCFFWTILDGMP